MKPHLRGSVFLLGKSSMGEITRKFLTSALEGGHSVAIKFN